MADWSQACIISGDSNLCLSASFLLDLITHDLYLPYSRYLHKIFIQNPLANNENPDQTAHRISLIRALFFAINSSKSQHAQNSELKKSITEKWVGYLNTYHKHGT